MAKHLILPEDMHGFKVHFVGIKGTGMVALVEIFNARGAEITGSDVPERFYTDAVLEKLGIRASVFSEDNVSADSKTGLPDLVVYSSAYKLDVNPDLIAAVKNNVPCMLYTEALGAVSESPFSAGICGVHGKTTVTGISGTVADYTGLPAQILAGSVIKSFGDSCTLNKGCSYFIAETCEYQRHFMSFHPDIIVLTSVESDHEDYYPTYTDILTAFVDYLCKLPKHGKVIYCADDKGACEAVQEASFRRPDLKLIPYGEYAPGDYGIIFGRIEDGKQYFRLFGYEEEFAVCIPGHHVVLDACAAAALNMELLKREHPLTADDIENIKKGLLAFAGAKRRSEITGELTLTKDNQPYKVLFIDDYGHHPTAIKTTLAGYRSFYPDYVIIADFMSHTYTRTAALLEDFAKSFESADEVILHKIYPSAREVYSGGVNGKILFARTQANHPNVKYFEEVLDAKPYAVERLKESLPEEKKGYLFVTIGAGDNWKLGTEVFKELKEGKSK